MKPSAKIVVIAGVLLGLEGVLNNLDRDRISFLGFVIALATFFVAK